MRHAVCRMTPRVNRRRTARRRKMGSRPAGSCPFSDLHENTPRCAVSACPRGPAERAARARRHGDAPRFRPPSASAGRHLASTLRLPARLRSSRPQDSAPAAGCGRSRAHSEIGAAASGLFKTGPWRVFRSMARFGKRCRRNANGHEAHSALVPISDRAQIEPAGVRKAVASLAGKLSEIPAKIDRSLLQERQASASLKPRAGQRAGGRRCG